jgi:hypothetical protein
MQRQNIFVGIVLERIKSKGLAVRKIEGALMQKSALRKKMSGFYRFPMLSV